jgi:hypothetical protein
VTIDSLPQDVAAALRRPGGHAAWAALLPAIEAAPDTDLVTVEAGLRPWDDDAVLRRPTEDAWRRLQTGAPTPPWWPLVRHVALGAWDRLEHLPTADLRSLSLDPALEIDEDFLAALPPVERLDLTACRIDAASLAAARSADGRLKTLVLSRSEVARPGALCQLGALETLTADAGSVRLADLADGFPRLTHLDVSQTPVPSFAPIAAMPRLAILVASRCTRRPAAGPLVDHPALRRALLDHTDVDDSGLDPAGASRLAALRA